MLNFNHHCKNSLKVVNLFPNVKTETEEEFEDDTEVLFHSFIEILTTITKDAMETLNDNHKIVLFTKILFF